MLQSRTRLLRTALLATALTTAIAVPAVAQPAAPAGSTIDAKRVKPSKPIRKAGDDDFDYSIEAGRRGQALAEGTIRWNNRRVLNEGTLSHEGPGRATVRFLLRSEDDDFDLIRRFSAFRERDTDFRFRERIDRIIIEVCHVRFRTRVCERERFFRDRNDDRSKLAVKKGSRSAYRGKAKTMVKPRSAGRVVRAGKLARTHRPTISRDLRSRKVESRDLRSRKVESRTFKSRKVESRKVESRKVESRKVHRTGLRDKVRDESLSRADRPLVHQR